MKIEKLGSLKSTGPPKVYIGEQLHAGAFLRDFLQFLI